MSSSSLKGTRLRLVLDTNVAVSGLLWGGHSRRLLELALPTDTIALYSSTALVDELVPDYASQGLMTVTLAAW